ncbi:MAG: adaptor protein MecA [Clostridia bacterium]|nr:adaptor protein MecA [Clostridia bacterium]
MKINSPAEDRIVVDLTKQDMLELDITYEDMDYSTIETRRVIWTVLGEAGKALGREFDPSRRMIIEASPKSEGGCTLCFTILDGRKNRFPQKHTLRKQEDNLICDFDNLDGLFRAAAEAAAPGENIRSSLFELNGTYRLILGYSSETLRNILSEFCTVRNCSRLIYEHTREHWHLLAEGNAVELLNL